MTLDEAFLQAILADPTDDNFRLIAADWLEEHGDGARSEFIRVQCELWTMPRESGGAPVDDDRWAFLHRRERELLALRATDVFGDRSAFPLWWQWTNGMPAYIYVSKTPDRSSLTFRRGFVAQVTLTTQAFLDHAARLFGAAPIEQVTLSDREPHQDSTIDRLWTFWNGAFYLSESDEDPREGVPDGLFHLLDNYEEAGTLWRDYFTREVAMDALSRACVAYGRSLAGLPPLTRAAHG